MKVLVVTKSFTKGGSASGASNLAHALESAGLEVVRLDAYSRQKGTGRGAARLVERVFERLFFDPESHCLRLARPTFDLPALAAEHRADIIQLCDVSGNVIDFAQLETVPCPVVHRLSDFWPYHGPLHYAVVPHSGRRSAQWLLRKTVFSGETMPDARVAPSHWLADILARSCDGRSPIRVIRNAVSLPETPRDPPERLEALRFGFISNKVLDPRKGFRSLLPALQALATGEMEVSLHVHGRIGDAEQFALDGVNVVCHGPFARSELPRVFDSFDILLCPSRLDNSPNVVCEALAHGRPVIAQAGSGMESYLDDNTGLLVDFSTCTEETRRSLAEACSKIAANYAGFSRSAAAYAAEYLSPQAIGVAYRELYRELIARCPRRRRPGCAR